jgi:phage terminase large subunit-like protein
VDPAFLERELRKAENDGEGSIRGFLAKHLNVEIGLALLSNRWAGADFWEACGGKLTLDELLQRSEVVTVGIDGGGLDDMLALSIVGREEETGRWLHWAHAWIHPIVLERRKAEAARFEDFARDGDLTIVQQAGEDIEQLGNYVERTEEAGLLDRVGVDAAGIADIVDEIAARNISRDRVLGISQGWKLVGAIKTLERRLAEKAVLHGGRPLMAWCVSNARVEPRGNAVLITKQAAGSAKIDPLMATLDATALMAMDPKPRKRQYQVLVGRV